MTDQTISTRLHTLRRWGISWTLIGFIMLLQDAFHFEGALWTMILIIVAWVIIPGPSRTTSRLRGMLELVGIILAFILIFVGSVYLSSIIDVSAGILLAIVSTGLGVVFQAWAELVRAKNTDGKSPTDALMDNIRKL